MNCLLLSVVVAISTIGQSQPNDGKMVVQKIDGTWTVAYAEIDGKKIENKSLATVTIKNNVLTCQHDGKEKTFKLEFGPHHMIRCTHNDTGRSTSDNSSGAKGSHTHHGVYIASQDYFCISLNKGMDQRFSSTAVAGAQRDAQPRTADRWEGHGPYGSAMVFVLRRESK